MLQGGKIRIVFRTVRLPKVRESHPPHVMSSMKRYSRLEEVYAVGECLGESNAAPQRSFGAFHRSEGVDLAPYSENFYFGPIL